ncbi:MAG: restriction endonuclease subunit R [Planctomyces sp.]|nr:restriction endonuclease subunit R [Planctomyces sp.]
MLELKNYQQRSLDDLQLFFHRCGEHGAKRAFIEQTERPYKTVKHFPDLPYVCLRIPTGGGKTLMAAHAVGIAAREYLQAETTVCLWLVPTNTIREQTLAALKSRAHPYRQALASRFASPVSILDLSEALSVQPGTLKGETVVIVSTLAALRVEETEGRKIYETAGALMAHFSEVSGQLSDVLEKNTDGTTPYSLANVLRLHRPVIVMDEAHNARTSLSFNTLARFNPSCVIEFTATPETTHDPEKGKFASNVLCHVSAAELKIEEMVKLPIRLETRPDWREVVSEALATREQLEAAATKEELATGEYIRPIVLLQAQPKHKTKETITVERLKQHLLDDCKIPEERIAVATGGTRELEDVNLFDRTCPVRFIITVSALKEGWDCSFAYVLCSVADIGAAKSVEQLLGRILRLPHARRKTQVELNSAYAFSASARFMDAAASLKDALVENGFERVESDQLVVQNTASQPTLFSGGNAGLFGEVVQTVPEVPNLDKLPDDLRQRVVYHRTNGTLTVIGAISSDEAKALEGAFTTTAGKEVAQKIFVAAGGKATFTSVVGRSFSVPLLTILQPGGQRELFEDQYLEQPWKLTDCDHELTTTDLPMEILAGQVGHLDLTKEGRVDIQFTRHLRQQLRLVGIEPGWDLPGLANWLDRQIPHPDISPSESRLFILRALERLHEIRNLTTEQLAQQKYRLREALSAKIDGHRRSQRAKAFQKLLFESADVIVNDTPLFCFHFQEGNYAPNWYYEGSYTFQKHFFPVVGELKPDGEEFDCAAFIDQLPEVEWWVRNLERKPHSAFWLQTPTDRFYPDFVAMLKDGRRLVVEYKGDDRWSNDDSKEKRQIGELWASASRGNCLFVMPNGRDLAAIQRVISNSC